MATDASLEKWGARLGRLSAQGRWIQAQSPKHINYLELSVSLLALRRWRHQMSQQVISVQMDNTAAVAYIVKEGGTQSTRLSNLAAEILVLVEKDNNSFRPTYLPGQLNTEADALSRQKKASELMLSHSFSRRIFRVIGFPVVDLFASAQTKQVRHYFSADRHDRAAMGTDALHQSWDIQGTLIYAFPPPMLIPLVVPRIH